MAKVPVALWVSFVIGACLLSVPRTLARHSGMRHLAQARNPYSRTMVMDSGLALRAPRNDDVSKPSCAHFDLFLGEENLAGMLDDILRLPSRMRRLPARLFHHLHLAHAAGAGNAQNLAGLVAREFT